MIYYDKLEFLEFIPQLFLLLPLWY